MGLGGVSVVSLAEAREEARRLRKMARAGGDPRAERRKERTRIPTFAAAAREFHHEHSKSFRNPKHKAQWLRVLTEYVFPHIGAMRVDQVASGDVLKALLPIWIQKAETARRVKQRMRAVFDWAKAKGYRAGDNPTDGLTKVLPKHNRQHAHHKALPHPVLPAFIADLRQADAKPIVKLAFELLILTALRTAEVRHAYWTEIDFDRKVWTVPGRRGKNGEEPGMKMKKEHRVPLSARAIEILHEAKQLAGQSPYIFPGRKPSQPLSDMAFNMCLRRMKRTDGVPHGMRSTFRDWASERTHFEKEVMEAALAHTVENKTEAAYFRSDLFEKRKRLMEQWAGFATSQPVAKVVKMNR
jgi:integrase